MDSLLLKRGTLGGVNALLAVVCDGVGSLVDGAFASGTAVQMLNDWFDKVSVTEHIGLRMRDEILIINNHVRAVAMKHGIDTASTLSALLLVESNYFITHIGDSRIYCYENEALSILTCDDVSESGKLTACIGQVDDIFLQYYEGSAIEKTFLLCSDGLYKRMNMDIVTLKMKAWNKKTQKETVEFLSQYVIGRGEQDNISLALVKIER